MEVTVQSFTTWHHMYRFPKQICQPSKNSRLTTRASSCVVVRGRARSCAVVRGRSWSCVVMRGHAWSVVRGRAWSCVDVCGKRLLASGAVPLDPAI